jgi:hypothetical protein
MAEFTLGARVAQTFYGERQEGQIVAMRRPDASAVLVHFDHGRKRMAFVGSLTLLGSAAA